MRGRIVSWLAKVKRRRGGVYLWRVDHHINRWRRVNGYVGETVSFYFRSRQHMGATHYGEDGLRAAKMGNGPSAPWSDLNPKMYRVISLPWWLCWKWVLRPLETLVILCTWPVYNDAKNRWNPRRITRVLARVQRGHRDHGGRVTDIKASFAHGFRIITLTALLLLFGFVAYRYAGIGR